MNRVVVVCFALALAAGCSCNDKTSKKAPKFELPTPDGMGEVTSLDFGMVQVNAKAVRKLTVRNDGALPLDLDALTADPPFGVDTPVPVEVATGATTDLLITFTPTVADQRVTGTLTLHGNDPARPTATVTLAGEGITAVARFTPDPIDFGDVYLGEPKTAQLSLTNAGSQDLPVTAASFSGTNVPGMMTETLSQLAQTLGQGTSASATMTWTPTASPAGDLSGTVELSIPPEAGGNKSITVKGHPTFATPRLCFMRASGVEQCADEANPSLQLSMGSFCDNRLDSDGGVSLCADGGFSGELYVRNDGNVPVSYTMTYTPYPYGNSRCDGGSTQSDFVFSNATMLSDGGYPGTYMVATAKLPNSVSDPTPWQSMPVALTYTATSLCREDGADQARVIWTRQGDPSGTSRMPQTLFVNFNAQSQLPRGVSSGWSCGSAASPATPPCESTFYGVNNAGDAPLSVQAVELWEEFLVDGGVDGGGPNGGYFQPCAIAGPGSPCEAFPWDPDGGDPNTAAPHVLAPTSNPSMPTQQAIGALVFGPGGSGCSTPGQACANTPYRIYAVIAVDDPYAPVCQFYGRAPQPCVISTISGYAQ